MQRPGVAVQILVALVAPLSGCGDREGDGTVGAFPDDQTCGLRVTLADSVELELTGDETEVACVTPFATSSEIRPGFVAVGHQITFELAVPGVSAGSVAPGFLSTFRVRNESGDEWVGSDCSVEIAENTLVEPVELGDRYRVVGSGTCLLPPEASAETAGGLTLSPFDFLTSITWPAS